MEVMLVSFLKLLFPLTNNDLFGSYAIKKSDYTASPDNPKPWLGFEGAKQNE